MPRTNLMRRLGTPTEIADGVCYLASPVSACVIAEVLSLDGGSHMWGDPWTIPRHDYFSRGQRRGMRSRRLAHNP